MRQDTKRDAIIEAAKKRFSHFGVSKTTMNEIADDLAISKASLYYYFPDKLNLYAAVLQHIIEAENGHASSYQDEPTAEKAIHLYLDNRIRFINKYYNILEYLQSSAIISAKELKPVFDKVRTNQLASVAGILEKGKSAGSLHFENTTRTAELFLACMEGIRASIITHNNFFPDKKVFNAILKQEKELASIFIRGLSI